MCWLRRCSKTFSAVALSIARMLDHEEQRAVRLAPDRLRPHPAPFIEDRLHLRFGQSVALAGLLRLDRRRRGDRTLLHRCLRRDHVGALLHLEVRRADGRSLGLATLLNDATDPRWACCAEDVGVRDAGLREGVGTRPGDRVLA